MELLTPALESLAGVAEGSTKLEWVVGTFKQEQPPKLQTQGYVTISVGIGDTLNPDTPVLTASALEWLKVWVTVLVKMTVDVKSIVLGPTISESYTPVPNTPVT